MKQIALIGVLVLLVGAVVYLVWDVHRLRASLAEHVQTRKLVVVDRQGNVRATLSTSHGNPTLQFHQSDGSPSSSRWVHSDTDDFFVVGDPSTSGFRVQVRRNEGVNVLARFAAGLTSDEREFQIELKREESELELGSSESGKWRIRNGHEPENASGSVRYYQNGNGLNWSLNAEDLMRWFATGVHSDKTATGN